LTGPFQYSSQLAGFLRHGMTHQSAAQGYS
jgi:hypothetical protein